MDRTLHCNAIMLIRLLPNNCWPNVYWLWCFNKYNWCLCRCKGKLYILLWTFLIHLS